MQFLLPLACFCYQPLYKPGFMNYMLILIATMLFAGFAYSAAAQHRAQKTASAKATYSYPQEKRFKRKKTPKVRNFTHTRPAKGTTGEAWTSRRKFLRS
jgi:hypothetical protein